MKYVKFRNRCERTLNPVISKHRNWTPFKIDQDVKQLENSDITDEPANKTQLFIQIFFPDSSLQKFDCRDND